MFTESEQLSFQERIKTKDWTPIPRISRIVPFGYRVDPNNKDVLLPVVLELEALEKAKQHLRQYSYRDVSIWLTETTGRYISHMGLKGRLDRERERRKKATTLRKWAERIEEAKSKAERLESACTGASAVRD